MKSKLGTIIYILIIIASLFIWGLVWFLMLKTFNCSGLKYAFYVALSVVGLLLGGFFSSLFHETFHVIFGKIAGMKFVSMRVGFLMLVRTRHGLRLKLSNSEYAGTCEMIPTSSNKISKKFGLYVFGGLFGSILHFATILTCFILRENLNVYLYALIVFQLPLSVYLLLVNLTFNFTANGRTDFQILIGLLKKDEEILTSLKILSIHGNLYLGLTPSEIDNDLVFNLPTDMDDPNYVYVNNCRYLYFLDAGMDKEAGEELRKIEEIIDDIPSIHRLAIMIDVLYNEIMIYKNYEKARELYDKLDSALEEENNSTNLRVRAAYELYVNDNKEMAIYLAMRGIHNSKKYFVQGIGKMDKKLIEKMELDLENARGNVI